MSESENIYNVDHWVVPIECDVARVSETNRDFAQFGQLRKGSPYVWRRFEQPEVSFHSLRSPASRLWGFAGQEPSTSRQTPCGACK
jgi:hypothetical protein